MVPKLCAWVSLISHDITMPTSSVNLPTMKACQSRSSPSSCILHTLGHEESFPETPRKCGVSSKSALQRTPKVATAALHQGYVGTSPSDALAILWTYNLLLVHPCTSHLDPFTRWNSSVNIPHWTKIRKICRPWDVQLAMVGNPPLYLICSTQLQLRAEVHARSH